MSVTLSTTNTTDYGVKLQQPAGIKDYIKNQPSTIVKILKAIADGVLLFFNPASTEAKNASDILGVSKDVLDITEVPTYFMGFLSGLKDIFVGREFKKAAGTMTDGALTLGEGANAYVFLMKNNILFSGTTTHIKDTKVFGSLSLAAASVFGTIQSIFDTFVAYRFWDTASEAQEKGSNETDIKKNLLKNNTSLKASQFTSAFLGLCKNINLAVFGAFAVISAFIAPAFTVAAEVTYFLTVGKLFWTVSKHYVDDTIANKQLTLNNRIFTDFGVSSIQLEAV